MSKVLQIALNTFRESVRDRVLYLLVFFAVLLMLTSRALGWVSVGEDLQIVQHISLASVSFFGALVAVFVGTSLIYREIDKRTIYTVLSKPVERWQFVVGKYLGLMAVVGCVVLGMGVIASGAVALAAATQEGQGTVQWGMFWAAILLTFFEMMVVTALAIFFSSAASPILAAVFTFCGYLIGQVTPSLLAMVEYSAPEEHLQNVDPVTAMVMKLHWLLGPVGWFFYTILPNLTYFQLRNRVVYGPPLDRGQYGFDGEIGMAALYAVCYSLGVLVLAVLAFDRRRF